MITIRLARIIIISGAHELRTDCKAGPGRATRPTTRPGCSGEGYDGLQLYTIISMILKRARQGDPPDNAAKLFRRRIRRVIIV